MIGATLLALSVAGPNGLAQSGGTSAATQRSEFEAISVHKVDPHAADNSARSSMSSFPTNLFAVRSVPLPFLMQLAYNLDSQDNISAMPGWMETQEYDVTAKVEGDEQLSYEQMRPMLQRLLEERFHLVVHRGTRMESGFALVVAKGGPKLEASKGDGKPFAQILSNRLDVRQMDAEHIAGVLAHRAGQSVVDRTGLKGTYDFTLSYAPANDVGSSLPDFFTALQEQLGLKLESRKVPVDFLIIDHVDREPTEN